MEDITFTAECVELDDTDAGDDDGSGDKPNDAVGNSKLGDGEESDENNENDNDNDSESGGGGAWEPNNQIIDNKTYYRDILEEYREMVEEILKDPDNGLTEEEIELIKKYMGVV